MAAVGITTTATNHVGADIPVCSKRLALAELEPLTCALLAVLLAFLASRIAPQETCCLQLRAQFRIEQDQRAGKAHLYCAGLSIHAATVHGDRGIERSLRLAQDQ